MLIFVPELGNHLLLVTFITICIAVTITMLRIFWYQKVFVSSLFVCIVGITFFWRYDCFDGNFGFIIWYFVFRASTVLQKELLVVSMR